MNTLSGHTVAITGAANGLGHALAHGFAAQGSHLALCDIDTEGLQHTEETLKEAFPDLRISTHTVDVTKVEDVVRFFDEALQAHPSIQVLINNAGKSSTASLLDHSIEQWQHIIDVNLMGVFYGCHTFLPHLLTQPEAHIVNISSIFGLVGVPGQSAYCASKFAVRGLSESLWVELANTNVRLTSVHPGGISTQIIKHGYFKNPELKTRVARVFERNLMSPERAARDIIHGVLKNKPVVLVTKEAKFGAWLKRFAPYRGVAWFSRSLNRAMKLDAFEEDLLLSEGKSASSEPQ